MDLVWVSLFLSHYRKIEVDSISYYEVSCVQENLATEVDKLPVNFLSRCPTDGQKLFPDPIKSMVSTWCHYTFIMCSVKAWLKQSQRFHYLFLKTL